MIRIRCSQIAVPCLVICTTIRASQIDAEPFDYFQNSWSVIGLKDYKEGTRVTPDNELLLAGGRKVQFRFGTELKRLSRQEVKTNLEGWMPILQLQAADGPVQYRFKLWATPLPSVSDWKAAFDWPVAGEDFLNWVAVEIINTGPAAAQARLRCETVLDRKVSGRTQEWMLQPGQAAMQRVIFRIPFEKAAGEEAFANEDAQLWFARTIEFWKAALESAAHISVPDEKATNALLAAHVGQLIGNDHGVVHGGEGFYDEFWARDGAYQILELEEAGLADAARKAIGSYFGIQKPDGRFESQKGELDGNGQSLWALWQFYKITGDKTWLADAYPKMRQAVDWLMKTRRLAPADSRFAGLLPNAVADGEALMEGKNHIVGYEFWNLRGLLCTADAARALGRDAESAELMKEAESYRAAIDAAWKRTGVPYFPPTWDNPKDGTHWGNTEMLWPTEIFSLDDPRVAATIKEVRTHHGGGFYEGTIRWMGTPDAIHPYMSAYTTMNSLIRGQAQQVAEDFYWYLLHSSGTHAFPEGIFFKRRVAWGETIPHLTGAANYAIMLRHMLVHEAVRADMSADELHLLAGVPDWWLAEGNQIRLERAPTHFGPLSLHVSGERDGVSVEFSPPTERPPRRIVLHLPESRRLLHPVAGVQLLSRPHQTERWDFPTVVSLYTKTAPPLSTTRPE